MKMQAYEALSEHELDRMERMVEAATSGPWYSYVAGRDPEVESSFIELGACNELGTFQCIELKGGTVADQDFIASARQDLPRLLMEVRMLRARLESLHDTELGVRMGTRTGREAPTALSA